MKNCGYIILAITASICLMANHSAQAKSPDLYAYYTKIDSGETREAYSLTGKYADVVVHLDDGKEFIFWRASSYLPHLKTRGKRFYADEIVPRRGDGTDLVPDRINQYSYARIIENSPQEVVVHWRYMPDFNPEPDLSVTAPDFGNVDSDGVVHEIFTIAPDGTVVRQIRQGRKNLDDFNDPGNVTLQKLKLADEGIQQVSLEKAKLTQAPRLAVKGSPVKTGVVGSPAAHFKFDEGLAPSYDVTKEAVSGHECRIDGHKSLWKVGVSETAV